ncbi:MAG: metal-dependent hydrolase [Paracoccaceae bacterium]|nr:metal-dependent hydrolase [Paracoccaceae bacterium]
MIIGHLPSGYILARHLPPLPLVMGAAILGGVFPDFDMIWFYLVDDRAVHHHRYWVHIPAFWSTVCAVTMPLIYTFARQLFLPAATFFVAVMMHCVLDTVAGGILWHWPFSNEFTHFMTIPSRYDNWIWNFVLHPVFGLELLIWGWALWLWKNR